MDKHKLGRWGETLAEKFLINKGIKVIDRNVYTPFGEIDLVAMDGDEVIMVEVKTRSNVRFGYPEEAVDEKKLEHIFLSAEKYFHDHENISGKWRVDVIAIIGSPQSSKNEIKWYQNVLE